MSETRKTFDLTNGWILCPSKSFPGKFYYFNVRTGETAWSLNQPDNKDTKKESNVQRVADKSHIYPEPTTLPDETTVTSKNIFVNIQNPDSDHNIPINHQLPTFGQAIFPKYVANAQPVIPNIVWTSVPFPMLCPEARKPMLDKVTQVSEFERELFSQSSMVPLCKRFKNYEKPDISFVSQNQAVRTSQSTFQTSTPKNSFLESLSESQSCFPKSRIEEPALKLVQQLPDQKTPDVIKNIEKQTVCSSSKVENTKSGKEVTMVVDKDQVLGSLDYTDLRFLLLAKRKYVDATDTAVERKKPKANELKPVTPKKKVTFDLDEETDVDNDNGGTTQEDFIPLTTNLTRTIQAPKPPVILRENNPLPYMKENYETPKTPPLSVKDQQPIYQPAAKYQPTTNYQRPTFRNTTWYIVVDTDVFLLDFELIDKIVLSDPKCRLIIPHAVASDIEALCLGDCRGQQRVINARQLTRKLATPPPHYIVEPQSSENGNLVVTTESILRCCMKAVNKNYYVVLITNDPYLQIQATLQDIRSYKLNELKYGVDIRPKLTSEQKYNIINGDSPENNQINYNMTNLKIQSEIPSQEKTLKMTSKVNIDLEKQSKENFTLFRCKSPVKKPLFLNSDSDTDSSLGCERISDITKPKSLKNNENLNKSDSDGTSDISSEVLSLNLKDKHFLKTLNVPRNPFLQQNMKVINSGNIERESQNLNNIYSFGNTNKKVVLQTNNNIFQEDHLDYNFENPKSLFCSIPITNLKNSIQKPEILNATLSFGATSDNKILNASQTRIKNIFSNINNDCTTKTQLDNQINKTKDSTGLFKIPQLLPIKNGTRSTSVHVGSSTANDKMDAIDKNLIRFRIKSRAMREKLKNRIDEWICSYMQIMEDALVNILQKNIVCMKNTAAPLTFRDTLNCIKMLYGSHTYVRDFINKLSQLLEKSMTCKQGKFKMSITPEDFMKLFGYGMLLILNLKNILPLNEELQEAESRLKALQNNLESNTIELDPELMKSPSVSRSEVDKDTEDIRPQFFKKTSYVIDYLKKHFKEWDAYNDDIEGQNSHGIENHSDFKVVRTVGKNLNLLKIDRQKTMSLSNNTMGDDPANKSKDVPKLIRLLENNQLIKPNNNEISETVAKHETTTKIIGLVDEEINPNHTGLFSKETYQNDGQDVPLKKIIENTKQEHSNESKFTEELNYTTHENTFQQSSDVEGPKIIRKIQLIDDIEKKLKNNAPLDLDMLDYSEIYEPSVDDNLEFDIITEKNENSEKNRQTNDFVNSNFGLDNTTCLLEDFYITPSISPDSKSINSTFDLKNTLNSTKNTSNCFNSVSENKCTNGEIKEKTDKNDCEVESDTFTEKPESHNDSCIGNNTSETHIDNSATRIDISETYAMDDSTNDSGFENDSTYAHSLVKIFLSELSSTFKVIHTFVTKFINEIRNTKLAEKRKKLLHMQARMSLEQLVAIINKLKFIIRRESADETILKILLRQAGVEATTDKRMMRYRQIVIKCLEQAQILESALKIVASTTKGDFEAVSTIGATINPSVRYFNIFE